MLDAGCRSLWESDLDLEPELVAARVCLSNINHPFRHTGQLGMLGKRAHEMEIRGFNKKKKFGHYKNE
jgi:hypothetical protein